MVWRPTKYFFGVPYRGGGVLAPQKIFLGGKGVAPQKNSFFAGTGRARMVWCPNFWGGVGGHPPKKFWATGGGSWRPKILKGKISGTSVTHFRKTSHPTPPPPPVEGGQHALKRGMVGVLDGGQRPLQGGLDASGKGAGRRDGPPALGGSRTPPLARIKPCLRGWVENNPSRLAAEGGIP